MPCARWCTVTSFRGERRASRDPAVADHVSTLWTGLGSTCPLWSVLVDRWEMVHRDSMPRAVCWSEGIKLENHLRHPVPGWHMAPHCRYLIQVFKHRHLQVNKMSELPLQLLRPGQYSYGVIQVTNKHHLCLGGWIVLQAPLTKSPQAVSAHLPWSCVGVCVTLPCRCLWWWA